MADDRSTTARGDDAPATATTTTTTATDAGGPPASGPSWTAIATLVAVLVVLVVCIVLASDGGRGGGDGGDDAGSGAGSLAPAINDDRFQAVYLDNERVYFGRLATVGGDWFQLRDAFFIRQGEAKDGKPAASEVVRVTEELAAPQKDVMFHADSVDMVQNLSADSSVAKAIDEVLESDEDRDA